MRLVTLGSIALTLLFLAAPAGRVAFAEDDPIPPGMTEDDVRRLRGKLRTRAATWWRHRKNLALVCPQCKGAGKVRWRRGRRYVRVDCPKCEGNKIRVDSDTYRVCFYEMRSPAFRLQEGIKDLLTEEYKKAQAGKPFPEIVKRYTIKKVEILGPTYGVVHVTTNKDPTARPQRWFLMAEGSKSPNWWLYEKVSDGPWAGVGPPGVTVDPVPEVPVRPDPTPEPQPRPAPPEPVPEPEPEPVRPKAPPANRVTMEESKKLVDKWTEERNELDAGVIRIELALETVEGYEEKVDTATRFLTEIKGWIKEAKPAYDRAVEEYEAGYGVRLDDRIAVNTRHFRSYRRIELIEKMLIGILPDLRKE